MGHKEGVSSVSLTSQQEKGDPSSLSPITGVVGSPVINSHLPGSLKQHNGNVTFNLQSNHQQSDLVVADNLCSWCGERWYSRGKPLSSLLPWSYTAEHCFTQWFTAY